MTMLSVEKRLARLEAIVLRNGTTLNDNAQRVDYIAACDHPEVFEGWRPDEGYNVGDKRRHNGIVYTCLQAHISQIGWEPNVAVSLWAKVLIPDANVIPEWEQPDSTNAYMKGDKVMFNGQVYESAIDNNVWSPAAYPAGWTLIPNT